MTVATYRRLLREAAGLGPADLRRAGEAVGTRLGAEHADLLLELEGLAAGAGQDVAELLAINARTELLAGDGECSLLARREGGGAWLAQTWDWHPDLARAALAWTVEHAGGWFTTVTEAGVLGKLGHNGAGVACGLNFLTCSADGGLDGVPIHVLLRLVLERCADGRAARELLGGARAAASSCITVATAGADLFAAEVAPGGTRVVEPDADGRLVHTNHFLRAPLTGTDTMPATGPGTLARRERLLGAARAGLTPPHALAQHVPVWEPICRHGDPPGTAWPERRATLLAVWAEPARRVFRVAAGPPCTTPFEALPTPAT